MFSVFASSIKKYIHQYLYYDKKVILAYLNSYLAEYPQDRAKVKELLQYLLNNL